MKGILTLFAVLILFSTVLPTVTHAQTPKPPQLRNQDIRETNQEFKEDLKNARSEYKETKDREAFKRDVDQAKEERKVGVQIAKQTFRVNRALIHADRLERRFAFYEKRLKDIANRVAKRIEKEKSEGKDVVSAQSHINSALTTLSSAVENGKQAVTAFKAITPKSWEEQKIEASAAKDLAKKARDGFAQTRKLLIDAVSALKNN